MVRIAHLSDLHYTHLTWNPLRLFSKRILGNLNWKLLRNKTFFEEQVELLPSLFDELGVDLVFFAGDFSTTSLEEEFEKGKKLTQKIKQPWYATAGNHDRYTRKSCKNRLFYRYFSNASKKTPYTLKEHRLEVHEIKKGLHLILLDTAKATSFFSSQGEFSLELEALLKKALQDIPKEDLIIFLNHYPFLQNDSSRRSLLRADALRSILKKDPRIQLYLHGHTHRHTVADLRAVHLPIVLDSGSCAQGKKGSWNLIDLDEKGCSISSYFWEGAWKKKRVEEFLWNPE